MLKRSFTFFIAISFFFLLQNHPGLWAAPNLSGIWSGECNPSTHVTISSINKGLEKKTESEYSDLDLANDLQEMLIPKADENQDSGSKSLNFKIKLYYVDNQVHIISLGKTYNENLLIFVNYAQFCLTTLQRGQQPSVLQNVELPLSNQGIIHHTSASGPGPTEGVKYEIVSDSNLSRDPIKDILFFKLTATIKTEMRKENKTRTNTINLKVAFPLKRVPFTTDAWADDEIDHLLTGASQHPLSQAATCKPPGNGPLSRVATFIFSDSREGYLRLFDYAKKKYNLSTPKKFDIDMDDYTNYGKLGGISGAYANMYLCRQAFSFNILFLASAYVHEYTHVIQFENGQKFEKFDRETEAHCIQKEWINSHQEFPGSLNFSKTQQTDKLDAAFKTLYGSDLQCRNGTIPRNWVRAKINSLTPNHRTIETFVERSPAPLKSDGEKWQVIVK